MSSSSKWDDPDPGVKWAMDLLDSPPGYEPNSLLTYYISPIFGAAFGVFGNMVHNSSNYKPLRTNLPLTIALGVGGFMFGGYIRDNRTRKHQDRVAVAKHYIMTHPELFPEPERKKFGDRTVLFPWEPIR